MKTLSTIILIAISSIFLLTTCKKKEAKACFTHSANETVLTFNSDCSEHASAYLWEFGLGVTSISKNPTVDFQNAGNHQVSLQISGPYGQDTYTTNVFIEETCVSCVCESTSGELFTIGTFCGNAGERNHWCVFECWCECTY